MVTGGVLVAVAVATLFVLVSAPVPHHFTRNGATIYDLQSTCPGITTVQGTTVSLHRSTSEFMYFAVVGSSENWVVYEANGTSGPDTFASPGGVYEFGSLCPGSGPCYPATVTGTHSTPFLAL